MYTDIYALERNLQERRRRAEARAAHERQLRLLPAQPSRLVAFLRRIGAIRPAPIQHQDGVQTAPSYRPDARPIPAR